jgi:G3E family GTPase
MQPIPITLLTCFLGSGKTSLVSRMLADPRFADTAVVINEFGEVGLDHALVQAAPEAIIEMTSGCLCCTIRGDIRQSLLMLLERSERGELPLFSRMVIETTGLADPVPVIQTLQLDPRLVRRYQLAQIVTTVDAVVGLATLQAHEEAVKQVAVADHLLITKTDMTGGVPADLAVALRKLNPAAPQHNTADASFDLRLLGAETGGYVISDKPAEVAAWLQADTFAHDHDHHHHHHHHHDEPQDVNRHSDDIRAFCLTLDQPISRLAFGMALELLLANQGPDMLRFKAIVALEEHPDQPVVLHAVQHVMHEPVRLAHWPDGDHRSKLVFITRGIEKPVMERFFAAWTQTPGTLPLETA